MTEKPPTDPEFRALVLLSHGVNMRMEPWRDAARISNFSGTEPGPVVFAARTLDNLKAGGWIDAEGRISSAGYGRLNWYKVESGQPWPRG